VPDTCRLLIDSPARGTWNMAVDEVLLQQAAATGRATLRFYQWSEPTLSLGYFQPLALRDSHKASRDCAVVRRVTGGGAILHDRELTYSLALPLDPRGSLRIDWLYDALHRSLVDTLAVLNVAAELRPIEPSAPPAKDEPFLCFQRQTPGDVLVGGVKVAGSAQRRRRRAGQAERPAVLQHGSVILHQSEKAPEIAGIAQITGAALSAAQFVALWPEKIEYHLHTNFIVAPLSAEEHRRVERAEQDRFADPRWTHRR